MPTLYVKLLITCLACITATACEADNARQSQTLAKQAVSGEIGGSNLTQDSKSTQVPNIESFTLDNGLEVVVVEMPEAIDLGLAMVYKVGTNDEGDGQDQYTHLIEHLMFRGSRNVSEGLITPLQLAGVTNINAGTGPSTTSYSMLVPNAALELALFMESDRMAYPVSNLTPEMLRAEANIVYRELQERQEGEDSSLQDVKAALDSATEADIRSLIKAHYHPGNAVLTLVGNIDIKTARHLANQYFSEIAPRYTPTEIGLPSQIFYANDSFLHVRVLGPGVDDPGLWSLDMLAGLMSNDGNAFLKENFVEPGHAKTAQVIFSPSRYNSSFEMLFHIAEGKEPEDIITALSAVLNEFVKAGPSEKDMESVRQSSIDQQALIFGLPQTSIAEFVGAQLLLLGRADHHEARSENLNAVTAKTVQKATQKWLINQAINNRTQAALPLYHSNIKIDRSKRPSVNLSKIYNHNKLLVQEKDFTLSNGIPVRYLNVKDANETLISIDFSGAGFKSSSGQLTGLPRVTGQIIASPNGTTAQKETGYDIFSTTGYEQSEIRLRVDNTMLETGVSNLWQRIKQPDLTKDKLNKALMRNGEALLIPEDQWNDPELIAEDIYLSRFYPEGNSPNYQRYLSADPNLTASITLDRIEDFYKTYYRANNASITIASSLPLNQIMAALDVNFGRWKALKETSKPKEKHIRPSKPNMQDAGKVLLVDVPGRNGSVIFGRTYFDGQVYKSPLTTEALNLEVIAPIIGGKSLSSRLNKALRDDKGWSYGVLSRIEKAPNGVFWELDIPVSTERTVDALKEVQSELIAVQEAKPITQAEVKASAARILSSERIEAQETQAHWRVFNQAMTRSHISDLPVDYPTQRREKLLTMTEKNTAQTVSAFRPDQLVWLIVGDASSYRADLKSLGYDVIDLPRHEANR